METQTIRYSKTHGARMRAMLQGMTVEERRKWATDMYEDYLAENESRTFEFEGLHDVGQPVTIRAETSYGNIFDPTNFNSYEEDEVWLGREAYVAQSENTFHDFQFAGLRYEGETVFHLPEGRWALLPGPRLNFESPFGTMTRVYSVSAGEVRALTELRMPRATIPVADIPRFNRFLEHVQDNERVWFEVQVDPPG